MLRFRTKPTRMRPIAKVNGPPGTGKTTLLRDLVAHVLVSRAELLAKIEDPRGDLPAMDLMDFAVVVASSNNTAVENVSLELPIRGKALDPSIWRDSKLEYFHHTADAVLDVPPSASDEEHAWGLLAARLGNAENRREFFERFWWDSDWGLNDWLNLVAWPDTPRNRDKPLGELAKVDPPPRAPEATASWRTARDAFRQALERCRRLRAELEDLSAAGSALRQVEARLPEAESRVDVAERDLAFARRAAVLAQSTYESCAKQQTSEESKLAALSSTAPAWFSKLFRTAPWRSYEAEIRDRMGELDAAQAATKAAKKRLTAAGEEERCEQKHESAREALAGLRDQAKHLARSLEGGQARTGGCLPGSGF